MIWGSKLARESCLKLLKIAYNSLKENDIISLPNGKVYTVVSNKADDCIYLHNDTENFHIFHDEIDLEKDLFTKVS